MADRALSEEAMLAGLRDIRLPPDAAGGFAAELLAAVALGLILAVVAGWMLRMLRAAPRLRHAPPPQRAAALSPDQTRLALLHDLKTRRPDIFARYAPSLYRPGGLPDAEELERALKTGAP